MLPFENMVADYVKETENHVMYRVTPHFVGQELVARGVIMEALSVEDDGEGVCFSVYVYNVQPGVVSTTPPARAGWRANPVRRRRRLPTFSTPAPKSSTCPPAPGPPPLARPTARTSPAAGRS